MTAATHELIQGAGLVELASGVRTPDEILAEAGKRALALQSVVKRNGFSVMIGKGQNAKEHMKVEGWITCGQFYGCTAKIKETEYVDLGGVIGFKAKAQLIHDATGMILSEAESYCMRDEDRWNKRTTYENGHPVGEEPVPLFQLSSMAQTRATAKVLAMKFRWIIVLAGYAETPAEEMTGNEVGHEKQASEQVNSERTIPYGVHKGKLPSDPDVPADYLGWMLKSTRDNLGKGKRKNYVKDDQEWIKILEAELLKRRDEKEQQEKKDRKPEPDKMAEEPKQTDKKERKPMDDEPWADWCQMSKDENPRLYETVADQMGIGNPAKLGKEQRNEFQDRFKAAKAKG